MFNNASILGTSGTFESVVVKHFEMNIIILCLPFQLDHFTILGLVIMAKWNPKMIHFHPYSINGTPFRPHHGDWFSTKGTCSKFKRQASSAP